MIQKTILRILFWLAFLVPLFIGVVSFYKPYQTTQPFYSLILNADQWNAVITAIERPDDVSNNQKKEISKLIQTNLKPIQDTTKKK